MKARFTIVLGLTVGCANAHVSPGKAEQQQANGHNDTGEHENSLSTGPCGPSESSIDVGTGEVDFEPLQDGDPIEVIHGAQDGHHILGSVRLYNTDEIATVHFWIDFEQEDTVLSDQVYRLQMRPFNSSEDCDFEAIGLFAYLGRIDPGNAPFLNREVVLHMDVEDLSGRQMNRSVSVIPFLTEVERDPEP